MPLHDIIVGSEPHPICDSPGSKKSRQHLVQKHQLDIHISIVGPEQAGGTDAGQLKIQHGNVHARGRHLVDSLSGRVQLLDGLLLLPVLGLCNVLAV